MPPLTEQPESGSRPLLPPLPDLGDLDPEPTRPAIVRVEEDSESDVRKSVDIAPPGEEADPHLGRAFGGYLLERRIGQGGMGTVYQGRQISLDRTVAVKILNKALYDNQEFIKRFEREAKSIARINHPNIVGVYDFGKHEGLWYMVNEFVEGRSIAAMLSERVLMPLDEFLPLVIQCLAGLAHVDNQGIIHRDIKPDNILVTRDGIAKIADFGLAKDVTDRGDISDLTAVGLAMGTPAYMSPEQCMGRRLDGRSDQYALGVTIYFALTGSKPFTGQSSFEIMTRQREHVPPPPHQLNISLSQDVSVLVMRMLAKDPSDRFPSAEACRQQWIELGANLGVIGPVTRSGEYPGLPRNNARIKTPEPAPLALAPLPPAPSPAAAPPPVPMPVAEASASTIAGPGSTTVGSSYASSSTSSRRPSTESHVLGPDGRPGSERHRTTPGETCSRCGHLNRAGQTACARCSTALGNAVLNREQEEFEAQRLLEAGQYRDAATAFARLADREQDRRLRSVLRAREREARRLDQDRVITDVRHRSHAREQRGDLVGALAVLEDGLRISGESAGTSAQVDARLVQDVARLRLAIGRQGRLRSAYVVLAVAVAGLVAAAWWMGWFGRGGQL